MTNYPKYYEYGGYNKLTSKDDGISVVDDKQELCVQVLRGSFPSSVIEKNGKTISASAFENCLQTALSKLNAMVQKEDEGIIPMLRKHGNVIDYKEEEYRPELVNDADDLKDVNI